MPLWLISFPLMPKVQNPALSCKWEVQTECLFSTFCRKLQNIKHIQRKEYVPYFKVSATEASSVTVTNLVTKARV